MQKLAQSGNGTAAYVDTLSEARKVLADDLGGNLFPIADDVKIQVEFNIAVTLAPAPISPASTLSLLKSARSSIRVS